MSRIIELFHQAVQGAERYFTTNRMIVLLLALLLAGIFCGRKLAGEKASRMLVYTVVMLFLVVCPVTAVGILLYQTGYYDYEWVWSMVPVTIALAYGMTVLLEQKFIKKKFVVGICVMAAVLFLSGNQGTLQEAEEAELEARSQVQSILHCMKEQPGQKVLWAPKNIMQEVRRQDGKILLIYGRDMWDAKAGAYDYEAYNETLTQAYLWLEEIVELERQLKDVTEAEKAFAEICEERALEEPVEAYLWTLVDAGVNTYVLPGRTAELIQDELDTIAKQRNMTIEKAYTESYTIYFLE